MAFAMGGQAAEEIYFDGAISTGAQNDLEKATELARAMVSQFGMSDEVGPISLGRDDPNAWMPGAMPKVSAHTAELIDKEVRRLLDEAHTRAMTVLTENRELLDRLSALLIATEAIDGDELDGLRRRVEGDPGPGHDHAGGQALGRSPTVRRPSPRRWPVPCRSRRRRRCRRSSSPSRRRRGRGRPVRALVLRQRVHQ